MYDKCVHKDVKLSLGDVWCGVVSLAVEGLYHWLFQVHFYYDYFVLYVMNEWEMTIEWVIMSDCLFIS